MNIKDLKAKTAVDSIQLVIETVELTREIRGGSLKCANAQARDNTGVVTLTLWNDDIAKFGAGDTIRLTKGWVGEFAGKLQLSAGKFGKIEKVA